MDITTTEPTQIKKKKLNPKQKLAIEYWLTPNSKTFGNLYKSCLEAGFSPSYALNISSSKPIWLSENVDKQILDPEHIKQGIQQIATNKDVDSRSPADTNLKAYELLGRYAGMDNSNTGTTINIVQPILNGQSVPKTDRKKVDIDITP
jgi:hypothetical protein